MSAVHELKNVIEKVQEDIDRFYDAKKKFLEATHAYNLNIIEYNSQRDKCMETIMSKSTGGQKKGGTQHEYEEDDREYLKTKRQKAVEEYKQRQEELEEERMKANQTVSTGATLQRSWAKDLGDEDDYVVPPPRGYLSGGDDSDDENDEDVESESEDSEDDDDEQLGGGNMNDMIKKYYYKHIAQKN
jgi:hypothetical protein